MYAMRIPAAVILAAALMMAACSMARPSYADTLYKAPDPPTVGGEFNTPPRPICSSLEAVEEIFQTYDNSDSPGEAVDKKMEELNARDDVHCAIYQGPILITKVMSEVRMSEKHRKWYVHMQVLVVHSSGRLLEAYTTLLRKVQDVPA